MKTGSRYHRRIRQIRRAFLFLEAVAAVILLQAAARSSCDLLRRIAGVVLSPRFVFLLGNAIVLLVFRSSGSLIAAAAAAAGGDVVSDLLNHHRSPSPMAEENAAVEEEERTMEKSPELRREEEDENGGDDVEFRMAVESFIERQLKFRRQESMEIVFSASDTLEMVPVAA